jgi:hypothetical protein
MAKEIEIIRSKGGTGERKVKLSNIKVPDLWWIIEALHYNKKLYKADKARAYLEISECWHLSHHLLRHLKENNT